VVLGDVAIESGKIKTEGKSLKNPMMLETPSEQLRPNEYIDTATLELLASWRRQDATDDAEKICAAEQELAEFKQAMNDARAHIGEPLLYP
jgi:hypothetical protein